MKIIFEKPPIYEQAQKLFNLGEEEKKVIFFTYGDTIFSPANKIPSDDVLIHEAVHAEQQKHDDTVAKLWWERYFVDADFRVHEEAEAYGAQYKFLCGRFHDRNKQIEILRGLAKLLASEIYGATIGVTEAMDLIKSFADKTVFKDIEDHIDEEGEEI